MKTIPVLTLVAVALAGQAWAVQPVVHPVVHPAVSHAVAHKPVAVAPVKKKRVKKPPTAKQLTARARMKQCAGQWKSAKASHTTGGLSWPKYWSACNKRLKAHG